MAAPTRFVPVSGGVQLATYERGAGTPIVMIHGLGSTANDWGPTADLLAARARLVMFDNRGAGQSAAPRAPFTLEQLADDTAAVFDAYGLKPAHLVGYSMGGMIAQIVAARRPELVDHLVLIATHAGVKNLVRMTPEAQAALTPQEKLPRDVLVRRQHEVFVARGFVERDRAAFERMLEVRLANLIPYYIWQRQLEAITQSDRSELVRTIRAPTLIIHGRDDPLIRFGSGEILRELMSAARFVALDDCGHMVNWEAPDRLVAAIVEFLQL